MLFFCKTPIEGEEKTESTWDMYNYGKYINQFLPNTIKAILQYERINKKICRQKMSIMFNEICIICIYIYIYIYSWPTMVDSHPNSPCSIATKPRCKGGHYYWPWITPLTLDLYLIMLSVKQGGIKHHFLSPRYDLGLNPDNGIPNLKKYPSNQSNLLIMSKI